MSMDANVRRAIEQANSELAKGSSASSQTVTTLIAAIAGYLSRADLSPKQKSDLETHQAKLEVLLRKR
jgi:hypothetical protein